MQGEELTVESPPEALNRNLRHALMFFSRWTEEGEVVDAAGITLISSAMNYGVFNSAVLTEPVETPHELSRRLAIADVFFSARGLRWSFWAAEDQLDRKSRSRLREVAAGYGLRMLTDPPGMFTRSVRRPSRELPAIELRGVRTAAAREDFCAVAGQTFELPWDIARKVYTPERAWQGNFEGYVGYAAGQPVASAALCVTEGMAGIYSVAVRPELRGRGLGEAMMRAVLEEARVQHGAVCTGLQSSPLGLRLYERMGYRVVTRYSVWLAA